LPTDDTYGIWPSSGEIDIMENVGFAPDTIVGSAHTLAYNHSIGTHKNGTIYLPDADERFHVYSLEWTEDFYQLAVDDQVYFRFNNEYKDFKSWPYDQRFHLLINIAYGGNWGGLHGLDPSSLPAKMYIDYVRVYE